MASVHFDPKGFYRRIPLSPDLMQSRITATADAIVLCHLGVAHLAKQDWSLSIDGLVEKPATFEFEDLLRFPRVDLTAFHQCAGSPLQPAEPTRRICNVTWSGVRLSDLLAEAMPLPEAQFVWPHGADSGEFAGTHVERYVKDLPLERCSKDVLVAYAMNGVDLRPEHGHPARLVVPGFYGTNSVKWLTKLTLTDRRADGPFTTKWYNDSIVNTAGEVTGSTPVWSVAPESVIVQPAPSQRIGAGQPIEIWGWAWADGGVAAVDVSTDAGRNWSSVKLEQPHGWEWQRFATIWAPAETGATELRVRAMAICGLHQPDQGARNAIHRVSVTVV